MDTGESLLSEFVVEQNRTARRIYPNAFVRNCCCSELEVHDGVTVVLDDDEVAGTARSENRRGRGRAVGNCMRDGCFDRGGGRRQRHENENECKNERCLFHFAFSFFKIHI